MSSVTASKMVFRFLDLAAGMKSQVETPRLLSPNNTELRNRIYHFAAISDEPIRITREMLTVKNAPEPYASLTRVCRQIRQECLQIQRQGADIEVDWHEAPQYLATFLSNEDNYASAAGRLRINVTGLIDYHFGPGPELDILPLLLHRQNMPKSMTEFVPGPSDMLDGDMYIVHTHICAILNRILDHHNKVWSDYIIDGKIRRIMVSCSPCLKVCIALRKDQIPYHIQHKWARDTSVIRRTEAVTDAFGFQNHPFCEDDLFECVIADGP